MKTVPIETQTIDASTGTVIREEVRPGFLLPPRPDACQVCGHLPAHPPELPHNPHSLYYQYAFFGEHGRWPTWKDAIAHCDAVTRARWEAGLRRMGKWSEPA